MFSLNASRLLCILAILVVAAAAAAASAVLEGTVSGPDGKPVEGVAVSARAADKTFTTTVFTDKSGKYSFPAMEDGSYRVWAQAVGFEYVSSNQRLTANRTIRQNFTLKALQEYSEQLSGDEWVASLPEQQPGDHRMKMVLTNTCAGCHPLGYVLQNRFDENGWNMIFDFMERTDNKGYVNPKNQRKFPNMHAYRDELVPFLARMRGPEAPALNYKVFRPKAEATQVIVTEYDLPPGYRPDYVLKHNGSNWSEGTPSGLEGWGIHDVAPDGNGNVWFSDDISPERTIGKLDTRTGKITSYKLPDNNGGASRSHGITVDQKGIVWFTNGTAGSLTSFDPKSEKFQVYPLKPGAPRVGGQVVVDSKGNLWAPFEEGAYKLIPATGEYKRYEGTIQGGGSYGIAVDSKDNAWYVRFGGDRLGIVDSGSGEVNEIPLDDAGLEDITLKDREVRMLAPGGGVGASIYQKGPRRLGGDLHGNTVWVALNYAGRLAKVDINSHKVTEYPLPSKYTAPYHVAVDKNHMVWINNENADRVTMFNPFTEKWTEYLLPTRGTESRHIAVDDTTATPTVYVPYNRNNKIARIQFRTDRTAMTQR